jgi:F5/8 type C domain
MIRLATVALAVVATIAGTRGPAMFTPAVSGADSTDVPTLLDGFESIDSWKTTPSDGVSLTLAQDPGAHGKAIRLDFDFHSHGGYAVIHKELPISLPANYEFSFAVRGNGPTNNLEFKLIDATGDNVWWSNQRDFVFPHDWQTVALKKRNITFAWGPIGGGEIKRVAAIEIAITAGSGGRGSVWLDDLSLTPLDPEGPYTLTPRTSASSSQSGHAALRAMDGSPATSWRSQPNFPASTQTFDIDFLKRREFGGMIIDWEPGYRPSRYSISTSTGTGAFRTLYTVERGRASRDYIYLPETDARYVRISAEPGKSGPTTSRQAIGIREITIEPLAWSATLNNFFTAVAHDATHGSYPKYFLGEQSYWTVLGVDGDTREGLVNEQGMLETGKGEFSVEPFLFAGGHLITWRDAATRVSSEAGYLPIKTVSWKTPRAAMTITAFAAGPQDSSLLYARYRITNPTAVSRRVTLYLALRPFQVNPPWQFLNAPGGVARIDSISYDGHSVRVNANRRVLPLTAVSGFGAMSFDEGNIVDLLRVRRVPATSTVHDHFGHASGVLAYDLQLPANGEAVVDIAVPLHGIIYAPLPRPTLTGKASALFEQEHSRATAQWREKLNRVEITLPASASDITETLRANLAYILINRDGPGIQPGSRSYERSWIRDGALTSAALLRLGHYVEVRDFIDWYSRFQFDNGKVPCCVDSRGADPVPENDSNGEFIYLVAEYYRHTGDRALLERMWPNVSHAVAFMDSLRQSRTTPEFQSGGKHVFYGLLPQSISHEGYSAKPMHSYWDDFFALRGFKDAAEIALVLAKPEAVRYAAVRDEFRRDFYQSIQLAMAQHKIDYIPGAAELGDFDATSTTIAINPADEATHLPQPALNRTFEKYYENFLARRDGRVRWDAYTPYELRVVGTFVRLGQKARAHELLDFFFRDQRPKEWHQWAEIVWHDPRTPKFIGDMPHTWVGSDYIRSVLDMFAYEREGDSSLVIGAGIPGSWASQDSGVGVRNLSTHYGRLSYTMRSAQNIAEIRIGGVRIPRGGLIIHSPVDRPIRGATVNGRDAAFKADEIVVRSLPASITLRY